MPKAMNFNLEVTMAKITRTICDGSNTNQWGPTVTINSIEEGIGVIETDLKTLMEMNSFNEPFDLKFNKTNATYSFSSFGKNYTITWIVI